MSLRKRTLITVGLTLLALILVVNTVVRVILLRSFAQLERQDTSAHVGRALSALDDMLKNLSTLCNDWASWDDSYAFIQDRNTQYIASNLVDGTFVNLELNLMAYMDLTGQIVFAKSFDLDRNAEVPLPSSLTPHLAPSSPLAKHADPDDGTAGLLSLPEGPLLLVSQPILPSDRQGPPRGALIMGRYLGSAQLERLRELTRLAVTIKQLDDPQTAEIAQSMREAASEETPILVRAQDAKVVTGYALVKDLYGEPALLVAVQMPRRIYAEGQSVLNYLTFSVLGTGAVFVLVLLLHLERAVLAKLWRLGISVSRIAASGDVSSRVQWPEANPADELAQLATEINRMLKALESAQAEKDRAQAALRDSQAELAAIFQNTPIATFLLDRSGRIQRANAAAAAFAGIPVEQMQGKPYDAALGCPQVTPRATPCETILDGQACPLQRAILAALEGQTPSRPIESHCRLAREGQWATVDLLVSATPLRIRNELFVLLMAENITELRQLQARVLHSQKMEAVGRLAGGIAHDFNNLLTGIIGYSEFVLSGLAANDPLRRDVNEIREAAEKASELTRQLLAFSRKQVLNPRALDLNALVKNMQSMVRRLVPENIELVISLSSHAPLVKADPGQIEQVLLNLVNNARDAMPNGGTLTIGTDCVQIDSGIEEGESELGPGRYALLTVEDTGVGMTEEVLAHLFEPFFTTKEVGKGTGLGLPAVFGVVKQSSGHITVESHPGQGTTFRIYLPSSAEEPLDDQPETEVTENPSGSETILVVDDEKVVLEAACRILQRAGYTVLRAGDPEQAIGISEQHPGPLHLLLTDLVMPKMNGPGLAQRLRQKRPRMKVLYMSGYGERMLAGDTTNERAFLEKPFTPASLTLKVREILDDGSL